MPLKFEEVFLQKQSKKYNKAIGNQPFFQRQKKIDHT